MSISGLARRHVLTIGAWSLCGLAGSRLHAQTSDWPVRQVKIIVPFGPGSGADIGARLISDRLMKRWGKPIVIDNRPGGEGIVAVSSFLAANDDHVLMFGPSGSFTVHPYQFDNLHYDFQRDLLPIARYSSTIATLAVPTSSGVGHMNEFVARARANPGKLNVALVPGITEFAWDGFVKVEGLEITKVPYKDVVSAAADLGEGRLDAAVAAYATLRPIEATGKIKVIAVTTPARVPMLPGVPSTTEAGFPSLEFEGLIGFFGPKIMSQELRDRVGADVVAAASDPLLEQQLASTGQVLIPAGAAGFQAAIDGQVKQVAAIAKLIGVSRK
jgi:tripartite-type tricarboxylate transporter receptor subunit TctC